MEINKGHSNHGPSCFGYPLSIFFIVINEFCERFSYYGMRAVLVIYFKFFLSWDDNLSTAIYHTFVALCYLTPILGALVADSWLGKFKTIISLSIVYTVGQAVLSIGSINDLMDADRDGTPDNLQIPVFDSVLSKAFMTGITGLLYPVMASIFRGREDACHRCSAFSMIGLVLIAFGTGGIKPCVAAFGGDQFEEHQEKQRNRFFSIFYLSINAGSLLSTIITPMLRGVVCGIHVKQKCYPLAFGVPAILMAIALLVFVLGSRMYKKVEPQGNIMVKVAKCITFAIGNRFRHRSKQFPKREHWLDWASEKYDKRLILQTKMVLKVLFLYIPLPMFWALFDQQIVFHTAVEGDLELDYMTVWTQISRFKADTGSRWTLQATTMDGDFGLVQIQPDQMQTVNPILIVIMVPIVDAVIYPLIQKCHINFTPLRKMTVGMFLAALAFVVAAVVQIQIDNTLPKFPEAGFSQVRVVNLGNENVTANFYPDGRNVELPSLTWTEYLDFKTTELNSYQNIVISNGSGILNETRFLAGKERHTLTITNRGGLQFQLLVDGIVEKPEQGDNKIRFINNMDVPINISMGGTYFPYVSYFSATNYTNYQRGKKDITIRTDNYNCTTRSLPFGFGSAYTIIVEGCDGNELKLRYIEDIQANTVSMAWQIPQYFLMTCGEVVFSVTGLSFSYSQAPANMKSVLQAGWLLTVAVGNIIVLIIAGASKLEEQWTEYVLFASLLLVVTVIFAIMAYFYTYVDPAEVEAQLVEEENKKREKGLPLQEYGSTAQTKM